MIPTRQLSHHESYGRCTTMRHAHHDLDHATSTPALECVIRAVNELMPHYASVGRSAGANARYCTRLFSEARHTIGRFVRADLSSNAVIFVKNTTEAINKLSYRFPFRDDQIVLVSPLEHHSNDLPWRRCAHTIRIAATPDGHIDEEDLEMKLRENAGKTALLAVAGASNVTGYVLPVHRYARLAHQYGARIVVDCAQLAGHRPVDMKPDDDPEHLDFVAFSGHKMYAPFGSGVLIGPKRIFMESAPEYRGGGTVDVVTTEEVDWAAAPHRDEAGTPNLPGVIAMAAAAEALESRGFSSIMAHEQSLTRRCLDALRMVPGVTIYGDVQNGGIDGKSGVISFTVDGVPHGKVAAALSYEWNAAVRNGMFCTHPYMIDLLRLSNEEVTAWRERMARGDRSGQPGMVRASFGLNSTADEIDHFVQAVTRIANHEFADEYVEDRTTGEYEVTPVTSERLRARVGPDT